MKDKTDYTLNPFVFLSVLALFLLLPSSSFSGTTFEGKVGLQKYRLQFFGFAQTEAKIGKAYGDNSSSIQFGVGNLRWGTKYQYGKIFGKLFLDFNSKFGEISAGIPSFIKDAWTGYNFSNALFVKFGTSKTPLGMGFTTPGSGLDVIGRNKLDKGLVLERATGIVFSGRQIGSANPQYSPFQMGHEKPGKGFGYDLGVFNPADRGASVQLQENLPDSLQNNGDALTIVGRIHYDYGELLHFEAAYGYSQEAGGKGTEDYTVMDIGVISYITPQLNVKAEYISGENINGETGISQSCIVGTAAWHFTPGLEAVIKHYQASYHPDGGESSSLGNTHLGFNIYFEAVDYLINEINEKRRQSLQKNRIQLNIVLTQGGNEWAGKWGYRDAGFIVQFQHKF
jgi:hypothetical protein